MSSFNCKEGQEIGSFPNCPLQCINIIITSMPSKYFLAIVVGAASQFFTYICVLANLQEMPRMDVAKYLTLNPQC